MKRSIKKAFSENDERYTPPKLVRLIAPYVAEMAKRKFRDVGEPLYVWCPFDSEESEFYRRLKDIENVRIWRSWIGDNPQRDFFKYEPPVWDVAVSNPPFSLKKAVFERLFELGKPFAMLMNMMALNYQEIGSLFADNPVQLLVPDKKISFDGKTSSFCSGYVCKDFLPKDLTFVHCEDNNTGENFECSYHLEKILREQGTWEGKASPMREAE